MVRYIFIAFFLLMPVAYAVYGYAAEKSEGASTIMNQDITHLKLYIGVSYFGGAPDSNPFDFTIKIGDRMVVDNELFPKGDPKDENRHSPDYIMIDLKPGTHILTASSTKGNANFSQEFVIERDIREAFAQINYNYLPLGISIVGKPPAPFDFVIQKSDFGWR